MSGKRLTSAQLLMLRICGVALMLASLGLVATTELRLIHQDAAIQRHGGEVTEAAGSEADPGAQAGMQGKMTRVAGPLQVVEPPRDGDFNLSAATPVLTRHVEMFQWREVHIADTVHYEMDWVDHPVDTHSFLRPASHANPGRFPMEGKRFDAGLVRVGGFALDATLLHAIPGDVPIAPDLKALPANLAASFSLYDNRLVTSADPERPRLGDVRVSWSGVPRQSVSILARLDGERLVPASNDAQPGFELQTGERRLTDMLPDVPPPPEWVTARRILAVLLSALGAFGLLLASGHPRHDGLLALATGTAVVGAVASMLWLGSAWLMVLGWLMVTGFASAVAVWRLRIPRI
jgi:hypothetical protein